MLKTKKMISLQEAQRAHYTEEQGVLPRPTLWDFMGEKLVALPTILADQRNALDNCGLNGCEGVYLLASLESGGSKEMYEL